jgi:hypothetical protein
MNIKEWSIQKMITIGATVLSATIAAGSAGWTLHTMYEDQPQIDQLRTEMVAFGQKSTDTILMQMMSTEQTRYEDEIERINARERAGHASDYDLNRRDTIQNRINQIERERNLMLKDRQ